MTKHTQKTDFTQAALNLARAGIPVFPVDAKKRPLVKWKGAAVTSESQIRKW